MSGDSVPSEFRCPFCPCVFCTQVDLDLHLKAFGNVPHLRLWQCVHVLAEVDGSYDESYTRRDWSWQDKRYSPNRVRMCQEFRRKFPSAFADR